MGVTAVFGAGVMGEALLRGMLRGRWQPADIVVVEKRPDRAEQ
ncbi:MAG: NAD(P)-binding domain-containing protein, partial [Actinomycetes bacterium]